MLETLLPIAAAFFIVAVSPGPANLAVATISMRSGREKGLEFGLGLSLGLAVWGCIAATGMGALLQSSVYALTALKILGGLYLLWLAFHAGKSAVKGDEQAVSMQESGNGRWFWRGLLLNLSNPKAVIAWMAALSMGLSNDSSIGLVATVTMICMAIGVLNYTGYALAFSLPALRLGYRRISRWVEGATAALFSLASFGLIRSAFSR
ncbi:MAG: LysE family translocator [Pseudomonadota bacterium]